MTISHVIYLEFARLIVSRQWVTEVSTSYSSDAKNSRVDGSMVHSAKSDGDCLYFFRCLMLITGCIGYESGSRSRYMLGLMRSMASKGPIMCCTSFRPVPSTSTSLKVGGFTNTKSPSLISSTSHLFLLKAFA